MKAVNKISQISAIVFSAAATVLFFFPFILLNTTVGDISFVGAQLAFGTGIEQLGGAALYKSAKICFCFILAVATLLFTALTFKFKKMRYWAPVVGLVDAIFMLVVILSKPTYFVDHRPLELTAVPEYTLYAILIPVALFVSVAFATCHLFVDDYIMVSESKDKKTILRRVIHFLRDYKSEVNKIVWPGLNDVVKNTIVVLVVTLIIGAFIWLLDFGLGQLMKLVTTL